MRDDLGRASSLRDCPNPGLGPGGRGLSQTPSFDNWGQSSALRLGQSPAQCIVHSHPCKKNKTTRRQKKGPPDQPVGLSFGIAEFISQIRVRTAQTVSQARWRCSRCVRLPSWPSSFACFAKRVIPSRCNVYAALAKKPQSQGLRSKMHILQLQISNLVGIEPDNSIFPRIPSPSRKRGQI